MILCLYDPDRHHVPFIANDLLEAVEHAIVGIGARALASLQLSNGSRNKVSLYEAEQFVVVARGLHSGLDDVKRVPGIAGFSLRYATHHATNAQTLT